jgi:transposase-like protein
MTKTARRKLWEERVSAFKVSGQTQANWCEDHEVNIHQLRYWLKKFRSEKLPDSPSPKWIPVKIEDREGAPNSPSHSIMVKVGEATIEVKPGFDPLLLANVVKVLSDNVR